MQQIATFINTKNAFAVNGHIKVNLPIKATWSTLSYKWLICS